MCPVTKKNVNQKILVWNSHVTFLNLQQTVILYKQITYKIELNNLKSQSQRE